MAAVVGWFRSGGAVLTKFSLLKSRDDGEPEGEDDHEMEIQPRSSEGTCPRTF